MNMSGAILNGKIAGDDITFNTTSLSGTFSNSSVGDGKTVTISGLTIQGSDTNNYSFTPQATTTANIASLDVNWTGSVSGDWNNKGNWNSGITPIATCRITITSASTQPILSGTATIVDLTIDSHAALALSGGSTLTLTGDFVNNGTFTANAGATTIFDGNTIISGNSTPQFSNVTVNQFRSLTGPLNGTINVSGNWTNRGTFLNNHGEVNFNPTSASIISGNNTFYDLESESAGKTLTFEAGSLQTVDGYLNLKGSDGNRLTFNSTNPGTQWTIDPKGTVYVGYVNGSDSVNIGPAIYDPNSTFVNSPGWFGTARPVPPSPNNNPNTPQINNALFFANMSQPMMSLQFMEAGPGILIAMPAATPGVSTPVAAAVPAQVPQTTPATPVVPLAPVAQQIFAQATTTAYMPPIVTPDIFNNVVVSARLPEPPRFANVTTSVTMPNIVPPSVFAGASMSSALPKPAMFSGVVAVATMPGIVTPMVFSGSNLSVELSTPLRFDSAVINGRLSTLNFAIPAGMENPELDSAVRGGDGKGKGKSDLTNRKR